MAGVLSGEPSHHGAPEGIHKIFEENPEEGGGRWYFSRKEIEENSPSRRDGIDLKKETYLRKSYCTFLQDLGMRLKVPQVTIATAIIFCHRFFLRQSHAKNDRREVYEQQKELILQGERVVLVTLGFDLNVHHPYKPLVEAIKKFKVAQNALAQVAWNFVNDGYDNTACRLRTSLCLQFKPHHIAAGAIFLAAKFLKVKLPSDGEKVWWQEFEVTPRQLEEVSNQMLELYEQNRVPPSQASEAEGSAGGNERPPLKGPPANEHVNSHSSSHGGPTSKGSSLKPAQSRPIPDQAHANNHSGPPRPTQTRNNDYASSENNSIPGGNEDERGDDQEGNSGRMENRDTIEIKDKYHGRNLSGKDGSVSQSPQDANKKLDREKLKAAFERRKALGDITRKVDPMDELERELEDVEIPSESEKIKGEKKQNWSNKSENEFDMVEEGEVEPFDDDGDYQSPRSSTRKRKPGSPLDKSLEGKQKQNHRGYPEDRNGLGRHGYSERDHKRHLQENHV
ncbi:hypothetical protein DH2020_049747 [Rehmannia glutinosa]|uniref:Cyclin-like domain-containing protein n=1 Tax=Rehmannia glutinosa TaxID=99300 RepID=A0ABR0U1Z7_REHGL